MKPSDDDFLAVVELIYAAAADPAGWYEVLERLRDILQTAAASISVTDLRSITSSVEWSVGVDPALADAYVRYYSSKNLYLAAGAPLIRTGVVMRGEDVVPDRIALRSEFVNDFLRPMGVLHHTVGCIYRDGALTALLNLPRTVGKPSMSASAIVFCRRLMPHLQRALAIHRRLEGAELERIATSAALDRLRIGTMILDRTATIMYLNRSAQETFAAGDGLTLSADGIEAARQNESADLRRQIRAACSSGTSANTIGGAVIQITRPSMRRAYAILVAPLRLRSFAMMPGTPAALLFIHDPEQQMEAWDETLRTLYGLTDAEVRVAVLLLRGLRVEDVAEQLAVSGNTARTHLKRIFSKTGAHSQSDLVRILLTGPAQLRPEPDV